MNGTEKQIKWANDIKKQYAFAISQAKSIMEMGVKNTAEGSKNNILFAETLEKITAIENETSAKWWIDNGKMGHDEEMQNSPLYKLEAASVLANPAAKIKAIILAVK